MKPPGVLLGLAAILAIGAAALASDPAPSPIPELDLKDGRVLHNVKVFTDEPDSIVVRASEGLIKIKKADLPPALAAKYPVRAAPQEFVAAPPLNLAPPAPPAAKPPARPAKKAKVDLFPTVFKGCTIVSFTPKPYQSAQGAAEVHIHNDTDAPVEIVPGDVVGETADGARHPGRFLMTVPDAGAAIIKRHDVVPAYGDLNDLVIFSTEAVELASVHWTRR